MRGLWRWMFWLDSMYSGGHFRGLGGTCCNARAERRVATRGRGRKRQARGIKKARQRGGNQPSTVGNNAMNCSKRQQLYRIILLSNISRASAGAHSQCLNLWPHTYTLPHNTLTLVIIFCTFLASIFWNILEILLHHITFNGQH